MKTIKNLWSRIKNWSVPQRIFGIRLPSWMRLPKIRARYMAIFIAVLTAVVLGLPQNFLFTLVKSLAFQLSGALAVYAAWCWWRRRRLLGWWSLICSTLIFMSLVPFFQGAGVAGSTDADLRVAHFNVLKFNNHHESTVAAALETKAHFISFQEVDQRWGDSLVEGLSEEYPYYKIIPKAHCYGLAVFSKFPLSQVRSFNVSGVPSIIGDIKTDEGNVHFLAAHTRAPTSPRNYYERNKHLSAITAYLENIKGPKIALGDFNAVPWDDAVKDLQADAGLSDSRQNLAPTYPAWFLPGLIPIDYILHSSELQCIEFGTIKSTFSDHYGIQGVYALDPPDAPLAEGIPFSTSTISTP